MRLKLKIYGVVYKIYESVILIEFSLYELFVLLIIM